MKATLLLITITITTGHILPNPATNSNLKDLCLNEERELEYERNQFHEFSQCMSGVLNGTEFHREILQGGDTSRIDAVVKKVCKNLSEIVQCANNYFSSIGPCMDQDEKREKELWKHLRLMNMEFACGVGRQDLIRFIDEGGIQCISTHRYGITECVDSKFPTLLKQQSDTLMVKTLSLITKEDGKCNSLKEVEKCVISELVKCMEPNSLSIIHQYFSSLDVLFDCVNSSIPPVQVTDSLTDSEISQASPQREDVLILSIIEDRMNRIVAATEQRMKVQDETNWKVLEQLQHQTISIQKIIHLLDDVIIPKLKKEKRKHLEQ